MPHVTIQSRPKPLPRPGAEVAGKVVVVQCGDEGDGKKCDIEVKKSPDPE